ncbi:MAG TPA: dethiobiotin synthase [Anseongella sp.]|nr:dethiobiotin synthase [Anseongella sp.]
MKPLFVTGIGTGVGKTIISALLVEKLRADYWKPIQSGDLDNSDTRKVRSLVSNPVSRFHPEAYRLTQPFSPHKSARLDGIEIETDRLRASLPQTEQPLIIEGAGGLMVPLNGRHLMIDLIPLFEADVIVVSRTYLGSINHTLLTLELLKTRGLPVKGIVFNGERDKDSEEAILGYSGVPCLGYVPDLKLDRVAVSRAGDLISW